MKAKPLTDVTEAKARELDRARALLERGKITFAQWTDTLAAWVRGEDISIRDYGDAEALSARIQRSFNEVVTPTEVSYLLGVKEPRAASALRRMVARGQAQRLGPGEFLATPPPTKKVPT